MEVGLDRSLDHVGKKTFTHLARKGLNLESRCANQSEKILLQADLHVLYSSESDRHAYLR